MNCVIQINDSFRIFRRPLKETTYYMEEVHIANTRVDDIRTGSINTGLGPRHQGGKNCATVLPAALLSWLATYKPNSCSFPTESTNFK